MANESTVVAQRERRELNPAQQVKQLLDTRKSEFGAALAGRVDPDSFIRVAYATITKTPKLLEATTASLMMSLLESASLGLVPNGVMGEAYIVPFNVKVGKGKDERWETHAQFIPGYRGLIKLARQSGVVRNIVVRSVWKGEEFDVEFGLEEHLIHKPDLARVTDDPREITHVYAVAHFHDGGPPQFEVMTRGGVERIRAKSKAKDSGPWVSDWEAMALKTVVRRLFKMLPSSDQDLTKALDADNREYARDVVDLPRRSSPAELEQRLTAIGAGASAPVADTPSAAAEEPEEIQEAEVVTDDAEPWPGPAPEKPPVEAVSDPLREALAGVEVLLADLKPAGGDATDPQRGRIRTTAASLYDGSSEISARLLALADNPELGKRQAGALIGKLGAANDIKLKAAPSPAPAARAPEASADPDDLFRS